MTGVVAAALVGAAVSGAATVRPPAVAGAFYPADPARLRVLVERLLVEADGPPGGAVAVVVPHAGYPFSGAVAARGFLALRADGVRRVVLIGPSHHRAFAGAALPARGVRSFATPLGEVELDVATIDRLRGVPGFDGPPAAHDPEHCLEVELPFLQARAPGALVVPVLVGARTDPRAAAGLARALSEVVDDRTVVVVSTDLTHHGRAYGWAPFEGDRELPDRLLRLGRSTAERIAAADPRGFRRQVEASGDTVCGATPVGVALELLAHAFDGTGRVLEVTTSGHVSGSWEQSVTYAAVAFDGSWRDWREVTASKGGGVLDTDQRRAVLELARATLQSHLVHDGALADWFARHPVRGELAAPAGAFVTLHNTGETAERNGRLRACMGVIEAREPLVDAVVHAAEAAAHDPRFPALEADELGRIAFEVSILSPTTPVGGPSEIEVGRHGVVLSKGARSAVFLPQVAPEQGWDRDTMLGYLALKAGLPRDGWRHGARFEVFTAQVFGEEERG